MMMILLLGLTMLKYQKRSKMKMLLRMKNRRKSVMMAMETQKNNHTIITAYRE
jgi:hypothetical protein